MACRVYPLVLLDIDMPVVDGMEVLRALPGTVHPAAVVLTSSAEFCCCRTVLQSEVDDGHLMYPFADTESISPVAAKT